MQRSDGIKQNRSWLVVAYTERLILITFERLPKLLFSVLFSFASLLLVFLLVLH